jgi:hypothetical protein
MTIRIISISNLIQIQNSLQFIKGLEIEKDILFPPNLLGRFLSRPSPSSFLFYFSSPHRSPASSHPSLHPLSPLPHMKLISSPPGPSPLTTCGPVASLVALPPPSAACPWSSHPCSLPHRCSPHRACCPAKPP